ncbi:hypothetical protein R3P38DRAFT_2981755 [Favolaschia claudopus]|uniref:Uncharacterized protein n=1 Tax=Favolaschia claudopus TaxID=2862362 RepID=A0AAW0AX28_9AGAR
MAATILRICLPLVAFILNSSILSMAIPLEPRAAPLTKSLLLSLISNVNSATSASYSLHDSLGQTMDTTKILQAPEGDYLAVYHSLLSTDNKFHASIATSNDLKSFVFSAGFGAGTSQPTVALAGDGGYVVAWEQEPNNHIAVRYYPDRAHLLAGTATKSFDAPMTLSTCAEGTPSIYSIQLNPDIEHSVIDIGGHYFRDCQVDRQQRGKLVNFSSWTTAPRPEVDAAVEVFGVQGNIGDRDALELDDGSLVQLNEGQFTFGDFGSWRVYLYDFGSGNAERVNIQTRGGSTAFANPSVTRIISPSGRDAIVVGAFLPSEGAAPGEAGQLLYYREF